MTGIFAGTERFQVLRQLGVGGMGVVYEALDKERGARVALKTLRTLEPHLLLRFKQEFRVLQGLEHPNLVTLLELHSDGDRWFFTMELVAGLDFLQYVRRAGDPSQEITLPSPSHEPVLTPGAPLACDPGRLRPSLVQLAEGLSHLHLAGKVHRDVKPSNILVTPEGRVVILDFGLVAEHDHQTESNIVGTANYMAPEQAAGRGVGPAADWYSMGVLLYEALTGNAPFFGHPLRVMQDKQVKRPRPPGELCDCPGDLATLCESLLEIDPERRPPVQEILRQLGSSAAAGRSSSPSQPFVGRTRELAMLEQALEQTRRGQQVIVLVDGASGVGKSALVQQFVRALAVREPDVVVLAGRYYEREAVPYRALDAIMDAVSHYLSRLPAETVEAILPLDTGVLTQLFPSLRGVEAVSRGHFRAVPLDPQEQRARVHAAVRELFIRLSRRRPVVLVIDDLQWSDSDSQAVLHEALRPPEGPPLLAIATHRQSADDPESSARALAYLGKIAPVRHLVVGPLEPGDARELAVRLLRGADGVSAQALAEEAAGHPLFIDALARHAVVRGEHVAGQLRLDDALAARIEELDVPTRRVLELTALCGGPLSREEALRSTALDPSDLARAVAALRLLHLVHFTRARDEDALEPFHDRVRELACARMSEPTRRTRHEELARAFEASGHGDPEALFVHWRAAGRLDRAIGYGAHAAARASEALAFGRAARLYGEALAIASNAGERHRLQVLHGEALANAGRGPEAAQAFAAALTGADREEALDLKRRVAEQLLRSGRIDAGLEAVAAVLAAVGIAMPKTPRRALASLLINRARLRLRGLGFTQRAPSEVPASVLTRIDTCWSVAGVLGMVDTIRGANFQTIHLRLALKAGEPFRVARALAVEAAFSAAWGGPAARRAAQILQRGDALATRADDPYLIGFLRGVTGVVAALVGRWSEGLAKTTEGIELLRARCGNLAWEMSSFQFFRLYSLFFSGRIRELCEDVPRGLREAEERGDLYGAAAHRMALANSVWLCADDPSAARSKAREAQETWSRDGFQVEHWWAMLADGQIDLYAGDAEAAWRRVSDGWPKMAASLLLRVQLTRIEAVHLRARAALAAATKQSPSAKRTLLTSARRDARRILDERMPWGTPLGQLVQAGAFAVEGEQTYAAAELERAIAGLEAAHMSLYAWSARRHLALLRGDAAGLAAADAWMRNEAIIRPDRMAAMLVPGFE